MQLYFTVRVPMGTLFFPIMYVEYAYVIPEGNVPLRTVAPC